MGLKSFSVELPGTPDDERWEVDEPQHNPRQHKEHKGNAGANLRPEVLAQFRKFQDYITGIVDCEHYRTYSSKPTCIMVLSF